MKLKLKKENLDLSNSMLKKFEKEKQELKASLASSNLSEEITVQIQKLLGENEELKKKLVAAEDKLISFK
jgi:hypothetical protein